MPLIDLTGKRFGKWTVIERDFSKKSEPYWFCKCDCGNEKSVSGSSLRKGTSKSCGRCVKTKNLIGQRFGKLVVLKQAPSEKRVFWECQCDCGNHHIVSSDCLLSGKTKSCGCSQYERPQYIVDETGHQYGYLTVIERDTKKEGRGYWICKCQCGSIISVRGSDLREGKTLSCGCLKSKGEEKISQILTENNIKFEKEKTFDTCRFPDTNALARFDFYLPDYNILIEYDGRQHFNTANSGWNTEEHFIKTQTRDQYKNNWCKDNNIQLIRIPYTDYDKINIDYFKEVKVM